MDWLNERGLNESELKLERNVGIWCMDRSIIAGSFRYWNTVLRSWLESIVFSIEHFYLGIQFCAMSRCFPFPPPGYEKKLRPEEGDLLKEVCFNLYHHYVDVFSCSYNSYWVPHLLSREYWFWIVMRGLFKWYFFWMIFNDN